MKKTVIISQIGLVLLMFSLAMEARVFRSLPGFGFGHTAAPSGTEWETPDSLSLNKLLPRADFFSFSDRETARRVQPAFSDRVMSLDGKWSFHWAPTPGARPATFHSRGYDVSGWDSIEVPSNWNIVGLGKDGSQRYGTPIYVNQPVIFMHRVKPYDWRLGVMREPPKDWTVFNHRNEVGSYVRQFSLPKAWQDNRIYICFDGVDSFFYLWINGHYVGFSKNSRNTARFDITPYVNQNGEPNTVAVEVYRNSDGSFLEAQDMFRLPGIFRPVRLEARPQVQISDIRATPHLNADGRWEMAIEAGVGNLSGKAVRDLDITFGLQPLVLYEDSLTGAPATSMVKIADLASDSICAVSTVISPSGVKAWSAEAPHRYLLTATLSRKGRDMETVSLYTGFRTVEIKDVAPQDDEFGQGGRFFLVNGQPVKLRGVNRHETSPARGHAVTPDQMEKEILMMKAANINHVRNSHYPDNPYWYYLCDRYGIYLTDEANVESHEYFYGDASLSHPKEWEAAHVGRNLEMVAARYNSPSVVIWSMGNEAGPGANFTAARDMIKLVDTSRPVHYERNNDIADFGSNQYPSIAWTMEAAKGDAGLKYPFYISEYAHSMGNALGNLTDYWKAIESSNHLLGGAIWDWVDQSLYNYDPQTGTRYLAYGGDFGDVPNDGQFVMNGIMFGDLTPKPQLAEVRKVYQPVAFDLVKDEEGRPTEVSLFNKNYFEALKEMDLRLTLTSAGDTVASYVTGPQADLKPRHRVAVSLDSLTDALSGLGLTLAQLPEAWLTVEMNTGSDLPWAPKGHRLAYEQFRLTENMRPTGGAPETPGRAALTLDENTGIPVSMVVGGRELVAAGQGPRIDAFRAFVNNDNWIFRRIYDLGLNDLHHKVLAYNREVDKDGSEIISLTVESQAPCHYRLHGSTSSANVTVEAVDTLPMTDDDLKFITNYVWTVPAEGDRISLRAFVNSNRPEETLPRIGLSFKMPLAYDKMRYYGRGPEGNYPDRKSSQLVGTYEGKVAEQFENFARPQNMANHENARYLSLWSDTLAAGGGVDISSPGEFSFTVLPYSEADLVGASHPFRLPSPEYVNVHLDRQVTGLGGNSCGQGPPLRHHRVKASLHDFAFDFTPAGNNVADKAVKGYHAAAPLIIDRGRDGMVMISPFGNDTVTSSGDVIYTVNGSSPRHYSGPFDLRAGGEVKAWRSGMPGVVSMMIFPLQEAVDARVIYVSSEEGSTSRNLTDGDTSTEWYTSYSKTVTSYPHWIDLDAGKEIEVKGLAFVPRQYRGWGDIKDYEIYLSADGADWGEPVLRGSMAADGNAKRLLLAAPRKARYVRFKALNSHAGHDYASAAEISILAD